MKGLIIFLVFIIMFVIVYRFMISFTDDNFSFCKTKYGEEFRVGGDRNDAFYSCNTVTENATLIKYYFTDKDYHKICKQPGFFQLNNWKIKCR